MTIQQDIKIKQLTIIGVGLIGGSFAIALRNAGLVEKVVGFGRSEDNLKKAVELGVVDSYTKNLKEAIETADVVFIAVPLGSMKDIFIGIKDHLSPEAIVTDGGSAKASVINDWFSVFGNDKQFIAGHPIAGTENSGVGAALADLYQDRRVILTPTSTTNKQALETITALWEACGADVSQMSVDQHDQVLAATSHLPHMLAYGLVETLVKLEAQTDIFKYAAGGFRDISRIASSSPEMWRDICLSNADALSLVLDSYIKELSELARLIKTNDGDALLALFASAKKSRDDFVDGL